MSINSIIFQYAAIGDYLFLILIVVVSIIQAITQNKKKKAIQELNRKKKEQLNNHTTDIIEKKAETLTGYEPPKHNLFDSIERMLVPELEDEKYGWDDDYAEAVIEEKSPKEEVVSSISSAEKINTNTEEKQNLFIPQKTVFDIPKISYKSRIREGFSLKKAVVYSEILNRKYT